ncbi:YihY/virulence factor BrkB family protein [Falsihalocynthiibacter arcticus]|uniref:Uncharacterized protein n=1 Tax=Falsihalocynthiibacter arcticus TaxID=1579316 RepID=A0A126UZT4_9RHOB|nr:YihY/virulence factor BrkB family protein [Falsihalocynthiibacter arcticus]AML50959.1 hypothetical protein RC74_06435 [Falsihalocynthiibacter arcticus]
MTTNQVFRAFFIALKDFDSRDGWIMCSHVAMAIMMAIFPFTIFLLALAGQLTTSLNTTEMMELIFGGWPDVVAEPIMRELRAVLAQGTGQTLTLNLLLTVFFASTGVDAIRRAISKSYRRPDLRPYWRKRLTCILFVLSGTVILIGVAVLLVGLPIYFSYFQDVIPILPLEVLNNELLRVLLAATPLIFGVFACHTILTGAKRSFRSVWPGVLLTIVLWAVFAKVFTFYLGNFANYSVTYAGLAGVMSGLMFLYLLAALLILGASFNEALIEMKQSENQT